jgi:hypothetical protein
MSEYFNYYNWFKNIKEVSNPDKALANTKKYLGKNTPLYPSEKSKYKYKVFNPNTNKFVYFGSMLYEDYLKHGDEIRKKNYLLRSGNIKGNWKDDKYSKNNLARNILWS